MQNFKNRILEKVLGKMAGLVLNKHKPKVIGVTGSVGKSTTKEMTAMVLEKFFSVGKNEKNFNTEIGVPLTVCGSRPPQNILAWPLVLLAGLKNIFSGRNYPEILVLEMGADKQGDIKYLSQMVRPTVGVLTNIGISHLEKFKTVKNLAKEKGELFSALPVGGWAVYNYDDSECQKIADKTKAEKISFGLEEGAIVRGTDIYLLYAESVQKDGYPKIPTGTGFKINYQGKILPVRLVGSFGLPAVYGALAAFSVGLYFQLNPVGMVDALQKKIGLDRRLNFKKGIKKTYLIDDCYNSAPDSLNAALDILGEIPAGRKIAVLGDMLELGSEEDDQHLAIGERLAKENIFFLAVGQRMKKAHEKYQAILGEEKAAENSAWFADSLLAGKALQGFLGAGDLVLIKGSRGMMMERVVAEVEAAEEESFK